MVTTALRGRVIPGCIVHERYDERLKMKVFDIVDGKQRLMTLHSFISGKAPGPTKLTLDDEDAAREDYEGIEWKDLHDKEKSDFKSYKMSITCMPDSTRPNVVFEIYLDINRGRTEHSIQQLRHAAYYENYIELLVDLAASEEGKIYREWHGKKSDMQEDQEMILRVFAFLAAAGQNPRFMAYQSRPSMVKFLNKELQSEYGDKKRLMEDDLLHKIFVFKEAVQIVKSLKLEGVKMKIEDNKSDFSFKTYPNLLEMTMVVLASLLSQPSKGPKLRNKLQQNAAEIIRDYSNALTTTAKEASPDSEGSKSQNLWKAGPSMSTFVKRYELLENVFKRHVGQEGPRTFSEKIKKDLFEEHTPCAICGKEIVDISHSEVDHVIPYSKGGQTVISNAQLVHTTCNRTKGDRL